MAAAIDAAVGVGMALGEEAAGAAAAADDDA
jgi:hypothetical protein